MGTTPISLTTMTVGSHPIGPVAVPVGLKALALTIDRTAGAASLNTRATSTTLKMSLDESLDSGTTWRQICSGTWQGGTAVDAETGQTVVSSGIQTAVSGNPNSATRQVRASIVVSGQSISLSGSLTTS